MQDLDGALLRSRNSNVEVVYENISLKFKIAGLKEQLGDDGSDKSSGSESADPGIIKHEVKKEYPGMMRCDIKHAYW